MKMSLTSWHKSVIIESVNRSFTTLDIISPGLDRFRPPSRSEPTHEFDSAMRRWGMGTHEIARPKSSPPPATRHACVHYKKNEKITKKGELSTGYPQPSQIDRLVSKLTNLSVELTDLSVELTDLSI